jgi:hypothetical protein
MAVTATPQFPTPYPVGNGLEFLFEIDSSGSGDIVYSIGYQLYNTDDIALTDLEQIPYVSGGALVDFAADINPHIYTTLLQPDTESPSAFLTDTNFASGFYVRYGQIEFDTANCITETSGVNQDSAEFTALNAAFQFWQTGQDDASNDDLVMLTDRPVNNFVAMDEDVYIHLYRTPGQDIAYQRVNYKSDGTFISSEAAFVPSSGAHVVTAGWDQGPANTGKYMVGFRTTEEGDFDYEYWFYPTECADSPYRQLYWIEPKGSQSGMSFEKVIEVTTSVSTRYEQRTPRYKTPAQYGVDYGTTISKKTTIRTVQMTKTVKDEPDMRTYLAGMAASDQHFVKYRLADGSAMLCKFILQDEPQIVVLDSENMLELTVIGQIHIPVNIQRQ